jgi:hypothetical protein
VGGLEEGWDGTYHGQTMPVGVYVFMVEFGFGKNRQKEMGSFILGR